MGREGPETRLVRKVRAEAKKVYGDRFDSVKIHGSGYARAGVSDLLICLDGVFVAAEAKAPESYGGSVERAVERGPSEKQKAYIEVVKKAGGVAGAFADLDGFMALLAEAEKKARKRKKKEKT